MAKDEPRNIRFTTELLAALQAAADANHRSLQNEVIHRLATTMNGETVALTQSAAESLALLVDRLHLDRTTLASAAINHYEMVTAAKIAIE